MPRSLKLFLAASLIAACLLPSTAAAASSQQQQQQQQQQQRGCRSADLRYPFMPGGPTTFGVFGLRIAHGPCATAHRVAKAWMSRFEAAFRAGHLIMPRSVDGFRFTTLDAHQAQEFRERGQLGTTTIWFNYRIPNG
jgi:hypothetical protein